MSQTHEDGLFEFYASQAALLLAQYENITQLLGPTTDWTHPGTHCETLLREFLRRYLLKDMAVDKGYVYGRVQRDGQEYHGPEIDLLIHRTDHFRPVFRLDDFVIVQPEAVLGMIQVKRTFRSGKDGALAKGMRQIVSAKQHFLDVTVQERIRESTLDYGGDATRVKKHPLWSDRKPVFTAVVSFEDETDRKPETFREILMTTFGDNRCFVDAHAEFDTSVYALPDFIGSLKGVTLLSGKRHIAEARYSIFDSVVGERNVGLQLFLAALTEAIFKFGIKRPPFSFPKDLNLKGMLQIPEPNA